MRLLPFTCCLAVACGRSLASLYWSVNDLGVSWKFCQPSADEDEEVFCFESQLETIRVCVLC